jgi:hypothetical protein
MAKPRRYTSVAGILGRLYAAKLEGISNSTPGHPERSEAESKDPAAIPISSITGFKAWPRALRPLRCSLDFARNDRQGSSSFVLRAFFVIRHSCFVISSS